MYNRLIVVFRGNDPVKFNLVFSLIFIFGIHCFTVNGQNQAIKWYFGHNAAIDFSSGNPIPLSNSSMSTNEGCSSIADYNGNLLFYTNGQTIWNNNHQFMANGTGLLGHQSSTQSSLIIKQPGNTDLYYVFTIDQMGYSNGLRYSVVDMSLAAGAGSVTLKNILLKSPTSEKLAATLHCNQQDVWIMSHDTGATNFRAYLLTASGLNPTPVLSAVASVMNPYQGQMKFSPNGKNLAMLTYSAGYLMSLYDFDNQNGVVANAQSLTVFDHFTYGCEFSPDGSKLYAACSLAHLHQWNLCAGSPGAIVNSMYTYTAPASPNPGTNWSLQLAPDGKIYCANWTNTPQVLSVINNPNASGSLCNFVPQSLSITTGTVTGGLPAFLSNYFKESPSPFSYSVACSTVSFSIPVTSLCNKVSRTVNSVNWDFGDPLSGSLNNSVLDFPSHTYPALGTYTVRLVRNYDCGTDTVRLPVQISGPVTSLSLSGSFSICLNQSASVTVSGAHTYSWSSGQTTSTVVLTPSVNTSYTVTGADSLNGCSNYKIFNVTVLNCLDAGSELFVSSPAFYPQPVHDVITVMCNAETEVLIYNLHGVCMKQQFITPGRNQVEVYDLTPGLYTIKLNTAHHSRVFKLLVASR